MTISLELVLGLTARLMFMEVTTKGGLPFTSVAMTTSATLLQLISNLHQLTGLVTGTGLATSSQQGPLILRSRRKISRYELSVPKTLEKVLPSAVLETGGSFA
jgi:hypothetical protein